MELKPNMTHESKPRIFIAPVEICNNMQRLAQGFRRKGIFATSANYKFEDPRGYMNDINLQLDKTPRRFQRIYKRVALFLFAISNYDVFHFFYGRTLLPRYADLPILRKMGKRVFMHFRGEDCLNYDLFNYWRAHAKNEEAVRPPVNTPGQARNIRRLNRYCHEFFISTPSLEQALPRSILVPQVVDLQKLRFSEVRQLKPGERIRIIHPTSSRWKFGTDFITQSIEELKAKGLNLDFTIVENVPHEKALEIFANCDIGIDTMLQGWYGNISIELMALGRPVVCFIRNKWKPIRPTLPIVDAHPRNLTSTLEKLICDGEWRRDLGVKGRQFVEEFHDVDVITDKLLEIYAQHEGRS